MQPKKPRELYPGAGSSPLAWLCAEADFFFADFIRGSILIAVSWCGQSCSGDYPQFFAKLSATPGPQPLFQTMLFWQDCGRTVRRGGEAYRAYS
jgi:hypothetical protein